MVVVLRVSDVSELGFGFEAGMDDEATRPIPRYCTSVNVASACYIYGIMYGIDEILELEDLSTCSMVSR